jgi:hypothetical protein
MFNRDNLLNQPLFVLLLLLLLPLVLLYLLLALFFGWAPFRPRHPRREYYVQDQVIVSGPGAVVERILQRVAERNVVTLTSIDTMPFIPFGAGVLQRAGLPADYLVGLYQIEGSRPNVERAIEEINAALDALINEGEAGESDRAVSQAEPNRITGSPWDPEPSPWDPEPSPWDPEPSPLEQLLGKQPRQHTPARAEDFIDQQAFKMIGLREFMALNPKERPGGQRVRVGVFDTSPFPGRLTEVIQRYTVRAFPSDLEINVRNARSFARLERSYRGGFDIRNHGLFAAGLIHAIAEESEIHLVRVLEKDKRGDLYTLLRALYNFLLEGLQPAWAARRTVINLSLGVRLPPPGAFRFTADLKALEHLMAVAEHLDVVVVASAGNDSANDPAALAGHFPARLTTVLGVASGAVDSGRACYSNQGAVAAPGGDGGPGDPPRLLSRILGRSRPRARGCQPRTELCPGQGGDCRYAVIGPAYDPRPPSGFIYWVGSSFAAPMVAGLAALALDCQEQPIPPAAVRCAILEAAQPTRANGAGLGRGIIHIPETLRRVPVCAKQYERPGEQVPVEKEAAV